MVRHEMSCALHAPRGCLIVSQSAVSSITAMIRKKAFCSDERAISARLIWIGGERSKDWWIRLNNPGHTIRPHFLFFFHWFSVSFVSFSLSLPHFVPLCLIFFLCVFISNSPSLSVHRLLLPLSLSGSDSPHAETQIANFEVWVKWQLQAFSQSPGAFHWHSDFAPMVMGRAANQALLWLFSSVQHLKEPGSWVFTKPVLPFISVTTHVDLTVLAWHTFS